MAESVFARPSFWKVSCFKCHFSLVNLIPRPCQVPREFRERSRSPNPYASSLESAPFESSLQHRDFLSENYYYEKIAQKSQPQQQQQQHHHQQQESQLQQHTPLCRIHNFNQVSYSLLHFANDTRRHLYLITGHASDIPFPKQQAQHFLSLPNYPGCFSVAFALHLTLFSIARVSLFIEKSKSWQANETSLAIIEVLHVTAYLYLWTFFSLSLCCQVVFEIVFSLH